MGIGFAVQGSGVSASACCALRLHGCHEYDGLELSDQHDILSLWIIRSGSEAVKDTGCLRVQAPCVLNGEWDDATVVPDPFAEGGESCCPPWLFRAARELSRVRRGERGHDYIEEFGVAVVLDGDVNAGALDTALGVGSRWRVVSVELRPCLFFGDSVVGVISEFLGEPSADGIVAADNASADWAELLVDALLVKGVGASVVVEVGFVLAGGARLGWLGEGRGRKEEAARCRKQAKSGRRLGALSGAK